MARGRMLNKKISLNPKVAELIDDVGLEAGIVFTWMIAHLDRDGRITGNPKVLWAQIAPLVSRITPEHVRTCLEESAKRGLVKYYQVDGEPYVEYPKFQQNQSGMRYGRETPSEIPEDSGVSPDTSGLCPLNRIEEKVIEKKLKKENGRADEMDGPPPMNPPDSRDATSGVSLVWDHWKSKKPTVRKEPGAADTKLIKKRLKEYPVADLCKAIDGMFNDTWEDRQGKLELIYAFSDTNISRFIGWADNPPRKPESEYERGIRERMEEARRHDAENRGRELQSTNGAAPELLPGDEQGRDGVEDDGRRVLEKGGFRVIL